VPDPTAQTVPLATTAPTPWYRRRAALVGGGVAAAAVLALGGFLAGAALHGGSDREALTSADRALPWGGAERALPPGPGHGPGGDRRGFRDGGWGRNAAQGTQGVITSVTGDRVVLRARGGSSVTVTTTKSTTVQRLTAGGPQQATVADLRSGDLIMVEGTRQADGSFQADRIWVAPDGLRPGSGRGPGWQGGPGTGPGSATY
jgi:hypothetical protein